MAKSAGYKKPPEHSRWKKGQSGNPRGRMKGQRNLKSDLAAEMAETVTITERGEARRISKQRAFLKALTARAIGGDGRAAEVLLKLLMTLLSADEQAPVSDQIGPSDEAIVKAFLARRRNQKDESTND